MSQGKNSTQFPAMNSGRCGEFLPHGILAKKTDHVRHRLLSALSSLLSIHPHPFPTLRHPFPTSSPPLPHPFATPSLPHFFSLRSGGRNSPSCGNSSPTFRSYLILINPSQIRTWWFTVFLSSPIFILLYLPSPAHPDGIFLFLPRLFFLFVPEQANNYEFTMAMTTPTQNCKLISYFFFFSSLIIRHKLRILDATRS